MVSQHKLNLKPVIIDQLAIKDDIEDLSELINATITIDNRLGLRSQQHSSSHYHCGNRINNCFNNDHRKNNSSSNSTSYNSNTVKPTPMELGSMQNVGRHQNTPFKKHLTHEEKEFRKKNNPCIYCGENTHFSNSCPYKQPRFNHHQLQAISAVLRNRNEKKITKQERLDRMKACSIGTGHDTYMFQNASL